MANSVWFLAAIFVAGIASSSACDNGKMAKCAAIQGELATAGKDGMKAMCAAFDKLKKCMTDAGCDNLIKDFQGSMDISVCSGDAGSKTGPGPKTGGEKSMAKCQFISCMNKKDCEQYKCVNKVKAECKDDNSWAAMYTGEFKAGYDKMVEKCAGGCGSLKPSLLIVLASAILMFLRSKF